MHRLQIDETVKVLFRSIKVEVVHFIDAPLRAGLELRVHVHQFLPR